MLRFCFSESTRKMTHSGGIIVADGWIVGLFVMFHSPEFLQDEFSQMLHCQGLLQDEISDMFHWL